MTDCPWCSNSFEPGPANQRFCSEIHKGRFEHGRGVWVTAHERKGYVGVKAYKRALQSAGGQETG